MFHVKQALRERRSRRHTRFVAKHRPEVEEARYWTAALRGKDPRDTAFGRRVDALAEQWRGEALAGESR